MAASEQDSLQAESYVIECSPQTFDHAAWLSAIHSEVLSVSEEDSRLSISPVSDLLRGEFEKLGASVTGPRRR